MPDSTNLALSFTLEEVEALLGMILCCDLEDDQRDHTQALRTAISNKVDRNLCGPIARKLLAAIQRNPPLRRTCANHAFARNKYSPAHA